MGGFRKLKKRVADAFRALGCCFSRRSSRVAPDAEAQAMEAALKQASVEDEEAVVSLKEAMEAQTTDSALKHASVEEDGEEVSLKEAEEAPTAAETSITEEEATRPVEESVADDALDVVSLTKSEDKIADQAADLPNKASKSSAHDDHQ